MTGQKRITACLLALLMLAGCATPAVEQTPKESVQGPVSMETTPILDYEVPNIVPGILVNQIGYEAGARKTAVVRGEQLPAYFHVVDASTGEVVYTGKLEEAELDAASGEYVSKGDFSEFTGEGEYYLECDIIGCSYPFTIQNEFYRTMMDQGIGLLAELREGLTMESFQDASRAVSLLLLSYELYGGVYDADGQAVPALMVQVKSYIDWMLTFQNPETGAVMNGETVKAEETAWLSAVLAKFSYTYQKFDSVYATACLQAADRAWKLAERDETVSEEVLFYAATELYRAAGQNMYHNAVQEIGEILGTDSSNQAQAFGTLTYSSTKRSAKMDLCSSLLSVYLDQAELIAEQSKGNAFTIGCDLSQEGLDEILWDAVIVSAIDYVITNSEYASILENYQNYICGGNEQALCFVYGEGGEVRSEEGIASDCVGVSEYIMLLSEIMSHKQED